MVWRSISIAIAGNLVAVLNCCRLLLETPGTGIRPMGITAAAFMIGVLVPAFVLPSAIGAIWAQRQWLLGSAAIALSLLPLPVSIVTFRYIAWACDLTIEP